MNQEQFKSAVAKALGVVGGFLAGWGVAKNNETGRFIIANWETISGILASLATMGWSIYANRPAGLVKATAGLDEVEKVVVNKPELTSVSTPDAVVSTK